jgi:thiamine-monophosphate kinase
LAVIDQRLLTQSEAAIILPMKVRDIGEFGLIELLAEVVGKVQHADLVAGIGDDAAVWRTDRSLQLGTTDAMIEDVHFSLSNATWGDLGWKALAINISDVAAMGGLPTHALVSLGLPPETDIDSVVELYRGLAEAATEFGAGVAGGNISGAPVVVVSVSLMGKAPHGVLSRSAASPGDRIAVTGHLGQSAAGLRMLNSGIEVDPEGAAFLRRAHLRPYPRVAEGQSLVQHGVKAAIDLSDGLVGDLGHIGKASRVSATVRLDMLPVHPVVQAVFGEESRRLALSGGEDYELLFTAGGGMIDRVRQAVACPVTVIGEIVEGDAGRVTVVDESGAEVDCDWSGWDHFRPSR